MALRKRGILIKDTFARLQDSTRKFTDEGYLQVSAMIARTGIMNYLGSELDNPNLERSKVYKIYRSPKEMFKKAVLDSFAQKPVTDGHPYDTGGCLDSETVLKKIVGAAGTDIKRKGDYMEAPMIIYDAETIDKVEAGKIGVSAGYYADIVMQPGQTPDGEMYDGYQANVRGNHIAIAIDALDARGGTGCRVLDSKTKRTNMRNKQRGKVVVKDATNGELPDLSDINQLGQMIQGLGATQAEGFKKLFQVLKQVLTKNTESEDIEEEEEMDDADTENMRDDPEEAYDDDMDAEEELQEDEYGDEDEEEKMEPRKKVTDKKAAAKKPVKKGKMMDTNAKVRKLQLQIDSLNKQLKQAETKKPIADSREISKIVNQRVRLITDASHVLPDVNLEDLSDLQIKYRVVKQICPTIALDKKSSSAEINGAYQAAITTYFNNIQSADHLAGAILDSTPENLDELDNLDSGYSVMEARERYKEAQQKRWANNQNRSK